MFWIAEIKNLHAPFIFFLRKLFIENAVVLPSKPGTPETIGTPSTIIEESAVRALTAELAEFEVKTALAVHAFVAAF